MIRFKDKKLPGGYRPLWSQALEGPPGRQYKANRAWRVSGQLKYAHLLPSCPKPNLPIYRPL